MAQTLLHSLRTLSAGMAVMMFSRKSRMRLKRSEVEPRTSTVLPQARRFDDEDAFLFDARATAFGAEVGRHSHAMNSLASLLGELNEVLTTAAHDMPIAAAVAAATAKQAPEPVPAEAADWSTFDTSIFDVSHVRAGAAMQAAVQVVDLNDELLFDEPAPKAGGLAPVSIIAQRSALAHGAQL